MGGHQKQAKEVKQGFLLPGKVKIHRQGLRDLGGVFWGQGTGERGAGSQGGVGRVGGWHQRSSGRGAQVVTPEEGHQEEGFGRLAAAAPSAMLLLPN